MFLRKVCKSGVFFSESWGFIENNLDYLVCFSFFWPKKWWISEKEFGSQKVVINAIGAEGSQ